MALAGQVAKPFRISQNSSYCLLEYEFCSEDKLGVKILTLGCLVLDAFQGQAFRAVPRIQINSGR
jgi:hypothetical protein